MSVESNARPRLALAAGSGGVRSDAAVGVAEVLAAEGTHPDRIMGRRLGALFGAMTALGLDRHVGLWETGAMPHFSRPGAAQHVRNCRRLQRLPASQLCVRAASDS